MTHTPSTPQDCAPDDAMWAKLLHGMLDGTLSSDECDRFGAIVASQPERSRAFARAALLHDAIERELTAGRLGRRTARHVLWTRRARRVAVAAVVLVAAALALWAGLTGSKATAAATELARIAAASRTSDRSYVIRAVQDDTTPRRKDGRLDDPNAPASPNRSSPPIDGALLHLRGADSYVLIRTNDDGTRVVSGSDGRSAWVIPDRGPVRVSADPLRFRGALPGSQHDLPFVDPRDGLDSLAQSYDLVTESGREADGSESRSIIATRKADARRGPKRVEIYYDATTALIRRMRLERLPQAQGGPHSVELDLVDDGPLDPNFFSHVFHHAPDRVVNTDD